MCTATASKTRSERSKADRGGYRRPHTPAPTRGRWIPVGEGNYPSFVKLTICHLDFEKFCLDKAEIVFRSNSGDEILLVVGSEDHLTGLAVIASAEEPAETPLGDLPADYGTYENREQAIADGVYVNVQGEIYNQIVVDIFYENAFAGIPAFMRVINYTIEGDPIIADYQYDGAVFTVTKDTSRDKFGANEIYTQSYEYLVPLDRSRPYGTPRPYYLSNSKNIFTGTPDGEGATLIEGLEWIPSPSDNAAIS